MRVSIIGCAIAVSLLSTIAFGQEPDAPPPLKPEELQQLVAPIALYPDDLLSHVLIASTYPLEVVAADRWVKTNADLAPEARKEELQKQSWDASVKSLTATPSVLATLSEQLDWTQKLGDAMLAQQTDVMDAVQALRSKAVAQQTLQTTDEQTVETQVVENEQVVVIQSAEPQTVYVPYYDPAVVYGTWAYPAYPPVYYPPPDYMIGSALVTGLAFGAGIAIVDEIWDDNDVDWGSGDINVDTDINIDRGDRTTIEHHRKNGSGGKWKHDPAHRRGVQYNNAAVKQKFNPPGSTSSATAAARVDFRGKDSQQVLQPSAASRPAVQPSQPSGYKRDMRSAPPRIQSSNRSHPTPSHDVSGIGMRNNNAVTRVGNGRATRAYADRGRSSMGAGRRAGGGRRADAGRRHS